MAVRIDGDGIAVACVARLLSDARIPWMHRTPAVTAPGTILLSEQTQHLLQPFLATDKGDPFHSCNPIHRRIVLWGDAEIPTDLPHRGIAVRDAYLRDCLWKAAGIAAAEENGISLDWIVSDAVPALSSFHSHAFGNHQAWFTQVVLRDSAETNACWVESTQEGWLFLLATGENRGVFIAGGALPEILLSESRLVAKKIQSVGTCSNAAAAYPQMAMDAFHGNTFRCGSGALRFDPLCGEGAGNAVREAYLVAALIRAAEGGVDREVLRQHYMQRLTLAMMRHLEVCLRFYRTGGTGDFWRHQTAVLERGIIAIQARLQEFPSPVLRLVERDLVPV